MKLPGTSAATVLLCLASPCVFASGYHPDLDEAFAKAEIVVVGRVVDAWDPEPKRRPSDLDRLRLTRNEDESQSTESVEIEALSLPDLGSGRVYQMRVERVFKGAVQRGQEVVFWDRVADSTAGYGVIEKARNLVFLVASRPSDFDQPGRSALRPWSS